MLKYFHGTSSAVVSTNCDNIIPSVDSGILREAFRRNFRDVVFVTTSKKSAYSYAQKAVKRFGGNPVVFEVLPEGMVYQPRKDCNEYCCDNALVLRCVHES